MSDKISFQANLNVMRGIKLNVEQTEKLKQVAKEFKKKTAYYKDDTSKNFTVNVGSAANPTGGTSITPSSSGNVYTFDCSNIEPDYFVLTNDYFLVL